MIWVKVNNLLAKAREIQSRPKTYISFSRWLANERHMEEHGTPLIHQPCGGTVESLPPCGSGRESRYREIYEEELSFHDDLDTAVFPTIPMTECLPFLIRDLRRKRKAMLDKESKMKNNIVHKMKKKVGLKFSKGKFTKN